MDNIQEYVSQAAAANFNQANSGYRPPMVSNQIRPPGFPPVQNPHANNQNNFNRGNNFNQNRGNNFNQVLRNIAKTWSKTCNPNGKFDDMLSKFVTANTASTSGSGTLPGNTVTNPKEDLKGSFETKTVQRSSLTVTKEYLENLAGFLITIEFTGITTLQALADLDPESLNSRAMFLVKNKSCLIVVYEGEITFVLARRDPTSSEVDQLIGSEGDIMISRGNFESEPPPPPPNQWELYMPEVRK
ncbi:hypothetical protein Tco_0842363 [Tanacetum coccineum]|uniref:Uncharacterized protein n=1 Tax=Tanacetum coccineum TaxID=301880 RepID=A0ABQ5AZY9_9ASTR